MAFSSLAWHTSGQNKAGNLASWVIGVTLTAGRLAVLCVAVDNNATVDGDEGAVSSVTDSAGSTWTKAAEFTNGQGAAQAGATISVWYAIVAGATVNATINFTNSASRDAAAFTVFQCVTSVGAVSVEATNTLANDGADPGSLDAATANIECLRVRAIAAETNNVAVLTATDGTWTVMPGNTTGGGGAATNMAVRCEAKISTGAGSASDPTYVAADCASVYVAFKEVAAGGGDVLMAQACL